jgi:hypothetical protein
MAAVSADGSTVCVAKRSRRDRLRRARKKLDPPPPPGTLSPVGDLMLRFEAGDLRPVEKSGLVVFGAPDAEAAEPLKDD